MSSENNHRYRGTSKSPSRVKSSQSIRRTSGLSSTTSTDLTGIPIPAHFSKHEHALDADFQMHNDPQVLIQNGCIPNFRPRKTLLSLARRCSYCFVVRRYQVVSTFPRSFPL